MVLQVVHAVTFCRDEARANVVIFFNTLVTLVVAPTHAL